MGHLLLLLLTMPTAPGIELPTDRPSGPKNTVVSGVGEQDSPAFPHPTYTKFKHRWEKCRALMGETEEVRDGGEAYVLRLAGEGEESYNFRLKLVALTNFFKRAVQASVGLLLEKEPSFGDDMPEKLVAFAEDIDLGGKHLAVYAKELAEDHVVDGLVGTLVDFPVVDNPTAIDADAEARSGFRPFFVKYTRADILKVVYGKINGVKTRVLVVLRETSEQLDGSFGIKNVAKYRVFRNAGNGVTWELWSGTENETATIRLKGPSPLMVGGVQAKKIPFSMWGELSSLPPLENLADLNIEHLNKKTNRSNLETLAMVPTPVRIGATPTIAADGTKTYPPIVFGPRGTIEAPFPPKDVAAPSQPVYWLSPDVSVLEPAEKSITQLISDMGTAALNFLAPDKRVAETAESKRLDAASQNASLRTEGRGLQDHLEECFGFAGEMVKDPAGSVTVHMEFEEVQLSAEEMGKYLDAYLAGGISRETFLDEWKKGKRLDESLDPVAEARRILKDGVDESDSADDAGAE